MNKISILILFSLILSACSSADKSEGPEIEIPAGVKESLAFEYLMHDVEGIVFNMLHSLHERDDGEIETHVTFNIFSGRGYCASQTLDASLNRLTLNFANGCSDESDRLRSGIIDISYTDPEDRIGNVMDITLNDFALNNLVFNGEIRMENVSTVNSDDEKNYTISFSNLELTINLEPSIFSGQRTIHYEKTDGNVFETTEVDYYADNEVEFQLSNGDTYNLSTPTVTRQAFECWLDDSFLPIYGQQTLANSEGSVNIDYDTGGCNLTVSLNTSSGESGIFTLSEIL